MANLKGSSFEKQIKDASIRLNAKHTKRHNTNSSLTHSNALETKRNMYLNDFKEFLEEKNESGKLNNLLTPDNVRDFLNDRLEDKSAKTSLDYTTGFNSLLNGLEQKNITIDKDTKDTLNSFTKAFREDFNNVKGDFKTDRAIVDKDTFLSNLRDIRESSYVVASVQLTTGLRVNEVIEVVNNPDKYIKDNEIVGVVGKGGQEYQVKEISTSLANKIEKLDKSVNYSTYQSDLKDLDNDMTSHDLRITYAQELFKELEQKVSKEEALKEVSKELNHHRISITSYYLSRA